MKDHSHVQDNPVDFYTKTYKVVQIVRCDKCGADLALEILDEDQYQMNLSSHPDGLRRITLGDSLLSSRLRLDGVMGYQCKCGNNTLMASIESGIVPVATGGIVPSIEPHHEAAVRLAIATNGYKPDVAKDKTKTKIESFTIERLKGDA